MNRSPVLVLLAVLWACVPALLFGQTVRTSRQPAAATIHQAIAVGDDEQFWLLLEDEQARQFTIFLHLHNDQPNTAHRFHQYSGDIASLGNTHAAAAAQGKLWIAFTDRSVHTFSAVVDDVTHNLLRRSQRQLRLPDGVDLRSLTAGETGWALVRVNTADTLAALDAADAAHDDDAEEGDASGEDHAGANAAQGDVNDAPVPSFPVDRLLELVGGAWSSVAMPDDWPHEGNTRSWAMMRRAEDERPTLVAAVRQSGRDELWVYDYEDDAWRKQVYRMSHLGLLPPLAVDGQLVIAHDRQVVGKVEVALSVLRDVQVPIGVMSLDMPPDSSFSLTNWQAGVVLVARDASAEPRTMWMHMDLRGQTTFGPVELEAKPAAMAEQVVHWLIVSAPLVVVLILMLAFWRRDPQQNKVELPGHLAIAELTRRLMAASIDMLPGLVIAAYLHDKTIGAIVNHWPWMGDREMLFEALTAIGIFVGYSMLFEMFTARTPGKMMLGMIVTDLQGNPPRLWSIIARNVFKAFDLVAVVLLLLPLLGPYRQRLGDLVARTVVVVKIETKQQQDADEREKVKSRGEE